MELNRHQRALRAMTRRQMFGKLGTGVGALALSSLLGAESSALGNLLPDDVPPVDGKTDPLALRAPHFAPKAKRVIYLHMAGSPPQLDLFDDKPKLRELNGQECPAEYLKNERFAFIKGVPKLLGSPYKFARHGESGVLMSELLPNLASCADEMTVIRSMHTDQFNHAPAQMFLYTGSPRFGRPAMGSWLLYGLGSETRDLPGFVVLVSGGKTPSAGKSVWGSGFLPSVYQGVQCRSGGDPILYVGNPDGIDRPSRRRALDALRDLNEMQHADAGDPETLTRIEQYELAFRMQMSVPEVMDITREPSHIHELYGAEPGKASFANNCLLARRLVEQGVRFVQLFDWGWDNHGTGMDNDLIHHLPKKCQQTDRPIAALIKDLRQRGLLDETLIVWSGEFGRTPMNEERNGSKLLGRDHHPHCFTVWMAGGGAKRGAEVGATDELGYFIADNKVPVHDLQATMLHLLGLDHEQLTYRFQGREFRLTDVFGNVRSELIA